MIRFFYLMTDDALLVSLVIGLEIGEICNGALTNRGK